MWMSIAFVSAGSIDIIKEDLVYDVYWYLVVYKLGLSKLLVAPSGDIVKSIGWANLFCRISLLLSPA
jgi:hypothetical protein